MDANADKPVCERWEEELLAGHRWGRLSRWSNIDDDTGQKEHARLRKLWDFARPLDESAKRIVDQILALEICNWNLEESILALCRAIGEKKPAELNIGHWGSVSEERLKKIWAYYLTLRGWLWSEVNRGHVALLKTCDPDKTIQNKILNLLGDRNELKELCVERFCLCLEFMVCSPRKSAQAKAHSAAVSVIEEEIRSRDPEGTILKFPKFDQQAYSYYGLELCHHKLFRHYEIIISSIGAGKWRAVTPRKESDGLERAMMMEEYLSLIESWINGQVKKKKEDPKNRLTGKIYKSLGKADRTKIFLASLLVSLLRSQQLAARKRGESSH